MRIVAEHLVLLPIESSCKQLGTKIYKVVEVLVPFGTNIFYREEWDVQGLTYTLVDSDEFYEQNAKSLGN